ncbi:MAG: Flp pilus assembly complex ATPase component TadA [Armatimonadetes bacterium]|nr:Flp pilus assembly complex ATPase component TadA [Armatimonadota bacterium]
MALAKKSLGQMLKEKGLVNDQQLSTALEAAKTASQPLGQTLIDLGFVDETIVMQAVAAQKGVPYVDLSKIQYDKGNLGLIPGELQEKHGVLPIKLDGKKLIVATADPSNIVGLDEIRMRTGYDVRPVLASVTQIAKIKNESRGEEDAGDAAAMDETFKNALSALGGGAGDFGYGEASSGAGDDAEVPAGDVGKLKELTEEAPIIKIVNAIFQQAIKDTASDIHIEPQRRGVRIRYRIDGVLHEVMKVPQYVHAPLVSRIKIMSDMNIAERRIPQDGRIHLRMAKKDYDMRVSTVPTQHGEKAVMRILDKSSVLLGLDSLGLYPETQSQLTDLTSQPNGMVISCGPTGSGKTTTQYSVLNIINSVEKNILTIEDPVEYQLPGLNQVHVNRKAGLSFSNALRSFLRQDPDIIMVGEVRDLETAEIAVQAALTGHLVLTTLHTNDAPSAVTRLVDMGVEPFLIAASVIGTLAQRLARRICKNCPEPYDPPPELLARFGHDPEEHPDQVFYQGRGCEVCRFTGYRGRLGIYELMRINDEIADMTVRRAPLSEIKDAARANGMTTLQEDGFQKVLDGLSTVDEIMRVVFTSGH